MKPSAFLAAIYVSFLSFALLIIFFGETGVTSLEKIKRRNTALTENLSDLESKQIYMNDLLASLRGNPESILVAARSLGLYRSGDKVLHFRNMKPEHSLPAAGRVLNLGSPGRMDEGLFRVPSLASGLIVLLISLIFGKVRDARQARR
jgi:hypothetical protein